MGASTAIEIRRVDIQLRIWARYLDSGREQDEAISMTPDRLTFRCGNGSPKPLMWLEAFTLECNVSCPAPLRVFELRLSDLQPDF
jgi:hypothetical protein